MAETETRTWFITGANRGIGLELTTQLLSHPSNVILATCRSPAHAAALTALAESPAAKGRVHVLALDVTDRAAVEEVVQEAEALVGARGVDFLVNNAAINLSEWDTPSTLDPSVMEAVFATNVVAPARLTQALLPLVARSARKTVVNVSSTLGSLGADFGTRSTSYAVSKAALNMVTYKQQKERPDIIFISMCPGWLRTDMGGADAPDDVATGVAGVLKTVDALTPADSGKFFNFRGEIVPW